MSLAIKLLTSSTKISDLTNRDVFQLNLVENDEKNQIKHLLCRFHQCLRGVNTLTVEKSSQKGPFLQLSNHVFWSN